MASINLRQEPLNLKIPETVAVIGCGGVGSWAAYLLALAGVKKIWLFDSDTISDHNLNRIPLPEKYIGKKKPFGVKELIRSVRPTCHVLCFDDFDVDLARNLDAHKEVKYVVVTTDNLASRQLVYKWFKAHNIPYVEASAEGEIGSATGSPAEWKTAQEDNPGYASVPVWVGPCILSATIAVSNVIHSHEMGDHTIQLGFEDKKGFGVYDSRKEESNV